MRYLVTGAIAFLLTVVSAPLAGALARRVGLVEKRNGTPYLGGAAIVVGMLSALAFEITPAVVTTLCGLVAVGIVGLVDDFRPVPPIVRVAAECAAAAAVVAAGIRVDITPWAPVNTAVTILWIVGITNSLNLLDNVDGLAAAAVLISAVGAMAGVLAAVLAGVCAGFLVHNRPPARIYMGDAGSLPLGFALAVVVAELDLRLHVMLLLCGLCVFDTSLVVVSRLHRRVSPFRGGTDHSSHRLIRLGLSPLVAVLCLCAFAALMVVASALTQRVPAVALVAGVVAVATFVVLLRVPAEDTTFDRA